VLLLLLLLSFRFFEWLMVYYPIPIALSMFLAVTSLLMLSFPLLLLLLLQVLRMVDGLLPNPSRTHHIPGSHWSLDAQLFPLPGVWNQRRQNNI
jgi:hypothetical protein